MTDPDIALHRWRGRPLQEDGESLDVACRDYGLLERLHKQEPTHPDQMMHYEAGWQAAVRYYFG